jgi:predicted amidohydrolase
MEHKMISNDASSKLTADVQNSGNIYDILASACEAFGNYAPNKLDEYPRDYHESLFTTINTFIQCDQYNRPEAFPQLRADLYRWLSGLGNKIDYVDVYALIYNIDLYCHHPPVIPSYNQNGTVVEFSGLNDINRTRFRILPRLNNTLAYEMHTACKWATSSGFRKSGMGESDTLNSLLKNYFIVDSVQEPFLPIIHQFSNIAALEIKSRLENKKNCLTVGLFPLWGGSEPETFVSKFTTNTFYIDGIFPDVEDVLFKRIKTALERCREAGVDIAIFPEMLMTQNILMKIKALIYEEQCKFDTEDGRGRTQHFPTLIVMGTIWESADRSNVSVILSSHGDVHIEQHKQTPFFWSRANELVAQDEPEKEYEKYYIEGLSLNNRNIHIIDIEDVGRFFTLICLDVLNPRIMTLLKKLRADFVLVPSFSSSKEITNELNSLTAGYWSTTMLCNACSALNKTKNGWISENVVSTRDKELGFVLSPAKIGTSQKLFHLPITFSNSCIGCQNTECPGRIIDIHYREYIKGKNDKPDRIRVEERLNGLAPSVPMIGETLL